MAADGTAFGNAARSLMSAMGKDWKVLAVGKSGVGKSTIGNKFLGQKKRFRTSSGVKSETQKMDVQVTEDGSGLFVDVPGIPDTNPSNTKRFYDEVITAAKNELHVILFVFKKDKIDQGAFKRAGLLFRELDKCQAMKILVINDHTAYVDSDDEEVERPPQKDYHELAREIEQCTNIHFHDKVFIMGKGDMGIAVDYIKSFCGKAKSLESPHLRTFAQLDERMQELTKNHGFKNAAKEELLQEIELERSSLKKMQIAAVGSAAVAFAATCAAFFTFGATLGVATPAAAAAAAGTAALELRVRALEEKEKVVNDDEELNKLGAEMEETARQFQLLKEAIAASNGAGPE